MHKADPTRPVLLNLGQGVAWDGWHGRGTRTNKPEDYPKYIAGGDIISFDIYPAVATHKDVAGKLWLVPLGVDRLRKWSEDRKIIWNCIETTRISNEQTKPTPAQVRAEVWMGIIHGSRGIIYFAHEFKPKFVEAGLLADGEIAAEIKRLNGQIRDLAAVINAPEPKERATVVSSAKDVPIDLMTRRHEGRVYVFCVAMRDGKARGTFAVPGLSGPAQVEVIGESRSLPATDGRWEDDFTGFGVHLYRIAMNKAAAQIGPR